MIFLISFALLFALVGLEPARAQAPAAKAAANPVEIKLDRKKVSIADGKEVLVAASVAKPGDVIEETATYTNRTKQRTYKVEATLPVPQYTELVMGSAQPINVKASIDGKQFAAVPLKRKMKQPNGVVTEQLVPLSEYRFLRWSAIDLGPEKSFVASARFRLRDTPVTQVSGTSSK
jgi:hypothetical protein